MKKTWIILLSVFLFLTIGAFFYLYSSKDKAVKLVAPKVSQINFLKGRIVGDSMKLKTELILENQSFFGLHIDSIVFKVKLSDTLLLDEHFTEKIDLPKGAVDTLPVNITIGFMKIRQVIRGLQDKDLTTLEVHAKAYYQTFFGAASLGINEKKTIDAPRVPVFRVIKAEKGKYHIFKKEMNIDLLVEIENKGKYLDLVVNDLHYNFRAEDLLESSGTYGKKLVIAPQSKRVVHLPVVVHVDRPLKTKWKMLRDKDQVHYTLLLTGEVEENHFLNMSGPVELTTSGVTELKK